MYAVVATSGRQYRVNSGDRIEVNRLAGEVGSTVVLDDVMMVGQGADVTVGTPKVAAARVEAQIVAHKRGPKIIIFKHKRRKGYRRKQGHRQDLTALRITGIYTDGLTPAVEAVTTLAPAVAETQTPVSAVEEVATPAPAVAETDTPAPVIEAQVDTGV